MRYKDLTDDSSGSLTDFFTKKHRTSAQTIETVRLGDYLEKGDVDAAMVKIDVEGAGSKVWAGAMPASERVSYFIFEMLAPEIDPRVHAIGRELFEAKVKRVLADLCEAA